MPIGRINNDFPQLLGSNAVLKTNVTSNQGTMRNVGSHIALNVTGTPPGDNPVTITGDSLDAITNVVTLGDTEVILVDMSAPANYITTKKFIRVTSIADLSDQTTDIVAVNFFSNAGISYVVKGYEWGGFTSEDANTVRLIIEKFRLVGDISYPAKYVVDTLEDLGFDNDGDDEIVDVLRSGARDYDPGGDWLKKEEHFFYRQLDFNTHFSGENVVNVASGQGLIVRLTGIKDNDPTDETVKVKGIFETSVTIFLE